MSNSVLFAAPVQALEQDGPIWVEAMVAREYHTPYYGKVTVTGDNLRNFSTNFKNNVLGQDVHIDYDHKTDSAKGNKAAGWFKDVDIRPSSQDSSKPALFALVDFTEEAKKEIKNKEWKYFSLEWEDEWTNNDGAKFNDVIKSAGLTNRPIGKNFLPINFSEAMAKEVVGEMKELEHSEPGTGNPPVPAKTGEEDEPDRKEGWRRPSPPDQDAPGIQPSGLRKTKEGSKVPEELEYVFSEAPARKLFDVLGIKSDTKPEDVVTQVQGIIGERDELKKKEDASDQEKKFAENYPQYWAEHNKLMEKTRGQDAKTFSESISKVKKVQGNGLIDTMTGLSPMARQKVEELHIKFAEGSAEVGDFEECLKTIINGGIVQFGEVGSGASDDDIVVDTSNANGIVGAKKAFAEVMNKMKEENPDWDNRKALEETRKKHPDLYKATQVAIPA